MKAAALSLRLNDKTDEEMTAAQSITKTNKQAPKLRARMRSSCISTPSPNLAILIPYVPRTSENFNINMSLSLEGIGAVLKAKKIIPSVVRLVPAGPADKGTLKTHQ